jgi:phosphoenolpyruvate carboxykinase (ATP)
VVTAILDGSLDKAPVDIDPVFGLAIPRSVPGVPEALLRPRETWSDATDYDLTAQKLARDLEANFEQFAGTVPVSVRAAGPASSR